MEDGKWQLKNGKCFSALVHNYAGAPEAPHSLLTVAAFEL
jgi:hypothetical protein